MRLRPGKRTKDRLDSDCEPGPRHFHGYVPRRGRTQQHRVGKPCRLPPSAAVLLLVRTQFLSLSDISRIPG